MTLNIRMDLNHIPS